MVRGYFSRRDGSPFLNLLMCAPLYDNKGAVRYSIGAQVDVSGLIEAGRGLESFEKLLSEERLRDSTHSQNNTTKKSLKKLGDLSQMFCLEESAVVQSHSRRNSLREDTSSTNHSIHHSIRGRRDHSARPARRVLGDDKDDQEERNTWGLSSLGPSGKLPGVYQNVGLLNHSIRLFSVTAEYSALCLCNSTSSSDHPHPSASSSSLPLSAFQASSNPISSHTSAAPARSATGYATRFPPATPSPQRSRGSLGPASTLMVT